MLTVLHWKVFLLIRCLIGTGERIGLIDMIRDLGYQIICEGVETDEQIEILRQIGCDEIQGYWYSKPLSMEDYKELLQSEKISKGGGQNTQTGKKS